MKTRNRRLASLALIAGCILTLLPPAFAAESVPGDACSPQYLFRFVGGPETNGIEHLMMCNGTTWQQRMTFTSAGNVGIGTAGPTAALHIVGANGTSGTPNAASAMTVVGGSGYASGNGTGAPISITGGTGTGTGAGGALNFVAGAADTSNGAGGSATFSAGSGVVGGSTFLRSGNAWAGIGGASIQLGGSGTITSGGIWISSGITGGSAPGNVGSITIQTPSTTTGFAANSGDINLSAGNGEFTGTGGTINITAGGGGATNIAGSNVVINGGAGGGSGAAGNVLLANKVGIGTTSPLAQLDVGGTGAMLVPRGTTAQQPAGINGMLRYNSSNGNFEGYQSGSWLAFSSGSGGGTSPAGSTKQIQFNSGGAFGASSNLTWDNTAALLTITGDINYTGTINDTSDRRLKTDIAPLNNRGSMLEKLGQLGTYSYVMNSDPKKTTEFGVMAQELQGVFPELVRTDKSTPEHYMAVNYMGLIAPMIQAMQEEKAMIDRQQAQIERQQAQIEHQSQQIDHLLAVVGEARPSRTAAPPSRAQAPRHLND